MRYSTQSGAQNTWSAYYYIVNQQGDVIALTNASGSIVAKYSYDAWGKVTSVRDASNNIISSSTHIGNINPIRYRGYYYDVDTQLYYLQSRYYDPEVGRFINADAYASTGQGIVGNNTFAYCGNNSVNSCDPAGDEFNNFLSTPPESNYRLVGLGVQLDASTGYYDCGVEIIVYWDEDVCNSSDPMVVAYTYEGISVNVDELLVNPDLNKIIGQFSSTLIANAGKTFNEKAAVLAVQNGLSGVDASLSGSVTAIFGNKDFTSARDYAGKFDAYSLTYNYKKLSIAISPTCIALCAGLTTSGSFHISYSQTNYALVK